MGTPSMNKDEFCFVVDKKWNISYFLLSSAFKKENVYSFLQPIKYNKNFFEKIINNGIIILTSVFYAPKKLLKENFTDKIVVFTNETLSKLNKELLLDIKKKSKAMILFFIDEMFNDYYSVHNAKEMVEDKDGIFDLVYTFSPKDAEQYGMLQTTHYYPKLPVVSDAPVKSVFFVGNEKNRKLFLNELTDLFTEKSIGFDFYVVGSRNKRWKSVRLPYSKVVDKVNSANVILDMADKRQTGMTLRYYEAVCYNKKLLTNNVNIVNMPYYDERYMKIYNGVEDIEKIDKTWFTSCENIDYGYQGEFEPKYFLEQIARDLGSC